MADAAAKPKATWTSLTAGGRRVPVRVLEPG